MSIQSSTNVRPSTGTKTGRVWEIADRISKEKGRRATANEVRHVFLSEGGNPNTCSTQYYGWKQDYDAHDHSPSEPTPGTSEAVDLQMSTEGRILIPADLRSLMLLGADGKVRARVQDGELRVTSPSVALLRLQRMIKEMDQGTASAVDELLEERKAEMRRE